MLPEIPGPSHQPLARPTLSKSRKWKLLGLNLSQFFGLSLSLAKEKDEKAPQKYRSRGAWPTPSPHSRPPALVPTGALREEFHAPQHAFTVLALVVPGCYRLFSILVVSWGKSSCWFSKE